MGQKTGRLSKCLFVQLLGDVWQTTMTSGNIISGFRSAGVHPVDRKRFPEHEFDPLDLRHYNERQLSEACPVPSRSSEKHPCQNNLSHQFT
ncbi:hypothetical protein PR048_032796 [Dryococelus australis]|uniref:Uncharacterized protein n=1 Tax=Dryococelus australis TaxID=614101 RepID=A0ABQ9G386_9NEOP|nr:hypothetical protein PR048_032796 [Dryococelus australis]